jgi:hypothetical protein
MAAQHVHEIDAAIKGLISSRRQEILQIAQNGANLGPFKNLSWKYKPHRSFVWSAGAGERILIYYSFSNGG